jgi:hypothetical protein
MNGIADIKCAKCKVPIQVASDPKPDTIVSCPVCGISDTFENAGREAADYKHEKTMEALNSPIQELAGRAKGFQFTPATGQKRSYRFVVDD